MHRSLVVLFVGAALFAGCNSSGPAATVKGTVTIDGAPLDSGTIEFKPDQGKSTPIEIKNGAFQGKAIISSSVQRVIIRATDGRIPANYNDMSGIQREIKAGENVFDFETKSKK